MKHKEIFYTGPYIEYVAYYTKHKLLIFRNGNMIAKYWKQVLSKWLLIFVLLVLVTPECVDKELLGPSNVLPMARRKRRRADCRTCGFTAYDQVNFVNVYFRQC